MLLVVWTLDHVDDKGYYDTTTLTSLPHQVPHTSPPTPGPINASPPCPDPACVLTLSSPTLLGAAVSSSSHP